MGKCFNSPRAHKPKNDEKDKMTKDLNENEIEDEKSKNILKTNEVRVVKRAKIKTTKLNQGSHDSEEAKAMKILRENNEKLEDIELIKSAFGSQLFLKNLDKHSINQIVKIFCYCEIQKGTTLFKQDSIGNYFYIVKEGSFELLINNKHVKNLESGDHFGELALLREAPRSGTIVALKKSTVYALQRNTFRQFLNNINEANFEENKKFVDSIHLLSNLDNDQKMILIQNLVEEAFEAKQTVINEGEIGSCLYIIKEGEVECVSKGKFIRKLKKGDYFGEKCILHDGLRTVSIITTTKCTFYSVSILTLKTMFGEKYKDFLIYNFVRDSFKNSVSLKKFSEDVIENICEKMQLIYYENNKTVLTQGMNKSSKLMVLVDGRMINKEKNEVIERGTVLFEDDLIKKTNEILQHDYLADPDCFLSVCDISLLKEYFTGDINNFLNKAEILETVSNIKLFKNLTQAKIKMLVDKIKINKFSEGQNIITQGETTNKFYIIKSGEVDVYINSNYTRTLNSGEYFGERSLFYSEPRSATVRAKINVEIYSLDQVDFKSFIEEGLKNYLLSRLALQDNVEIEDLEYLKDLGSGGYGKVYLVRSKKNKCNYAIKSISRLKVDVEEIHPYIEREKILLLQIDHPFIVKLVKTLGDKRYIFFLMEFVKGKELWDVIREIGLLNKYQTQFYGNSLLIAIEYLQKKSIIHRDLKPENVIVTETGYIKLIDFGTAKKIIDRASTIIGSPHYMAPEVILGKGYTFSIDVWSIAIMLYEFLCGEVPFGNDAQDPMDIYSEIVKGDFKVPSFVKDKLFISLMKKMLEKNIVKRLFKVPLIMQHAWMTDFEWDKLKNLDIKIPYLPKAKNYELNAEENPIEFIEFINKEPIWNNPEKKQVKKEKKDEYDSWHKNF